MISAKRILILGPHPDDGEFGCGANIARFAEEGAEVRLHIFSLCKESLPDGISEKDIEGELLESAKAMGISGAKVKIRNYPVRHFFRHRQEILEELVVDRNSFDPDIIFLPSTTDIHQDHQVISQEGIRAFKHASIFGYELPWNMASFSGQATLEVQESHMEKKIDALAKYKSQAFRSYFDPAYIQSLAKVRGLLTSSKWAEAFEVIRIKA